MISGPHIKDFSNLILEILGMYSDDIVMKVVDFTDTDERYKAVQKIFDKNLSEAEFLKELEKLGA